jgi:acylphosphatase
MVSKHIVVSGQVQGVGFRNFTHRVAQSLGIVGWARNLSSGEVEILAKALVTSMEVFISQIRVGPARATVEKLEIFDVDSSLIQGDNFQIAPDGEKKSEF